MAWIASFALCMLGDVMLGRWVLLPLFIAAFYGGTFIIALVTYPLLSFWRGLLSRRGLIAWYLIEVGGLWGGTMLMLLVLSPWWLRWSWSGTSSLQVLGLVLFVGAVVAGTWAVAKMGWARWDGQGCCSPEPCFPRGPGPKRTVFPIGCGLVHMDAPYLMTRTAEAMKAEAAQSGTRTGLGTGLTPASPASVGRSIPRLRVRPTGALGDQEPVRRPLACDDYSQ